MQIALNLKSSAEYAYWIGNANIVAEQERNGALITITEEKGGYSIYRTFQIGDKVVVSCDAQATGVENVFNYLLGVSK